MVLTKLTGQLLKLRVARDDWATGQPSVLPSNKVGVEPRRQGCGAIANANIERTVRLRETQTVQPIT